MPSFDIVSRVNLPEVDNAIQGVRRELTQRYDFKDTKSSVERNEGTLTIVADDDMRLRQLHELLQTYLVRRQVDPESLEYQTPEDASGGTLRQLVLVREGIPADMAKRITKAIKDAKLKVQATIQGNELRVTGKKRDALQQTISLVKELDIGQPVQYVNMRD